MPSKNSKASEDIDMNKYRAIKMYNLLKCKIYSLYSSKICHKSMSERSLKIVVGYALELLFFKETIRDLQLKKRNTWKTT